MKKNLLTVLNEHGNKETIDVIKYFTLNTNQKDYIIYKVQNSNILYAAEIKETENEIMLLEVKEKEIKQELMSIMEVIKNG